MSNVFAIMRSDMRRLFANVMSIVITVGLIVVPSLFSWYNTIACWNVFDNTGNLKVAVANTDTGYKSDLVPITVNVGDQVISALRANSQIDWVFTDEEDAVDGAAAGRYYAAVVIPQDFSRDMMTFFSSDAEHSSIIYYSNEKKSAIAPKITDQGADTVAYEVNATFAKTLSEISIGIASSLSSYLDETDATGAVQQLSERVGAAGGEMQRASSVLLLYTSLVGQTQGLLSDTADLADTASAASANATGSAATVTENAIAAAQGLLKNARELSGKLDDAKTQLEEAETALEPILPALPDETREKAEKLLADAKSALDTTKSSLDSEVIPALEKLVTKAGDVGASAQEGLESLSSASSALAQTARNAGATLGGAIEKVSDAASRLSDAGAQTSQLSADLQDALASGDIEKLRELLTSDAEALATALSAPIGMERIPLYPVENFGSAMSPLYTTLALFIGSLLILVAMKPAVSEREQRRLHDPKPWQLFFGRFGAMAFISLCQSTLMALGNMLFLQVQVMHPLLFLLCFWLSGIVFTFLIYSLVAVFANLGKAVAVLLLIVQVTGCGGSFPLQILPQFIQNLSPWLPATHTVNAMREAMMGAYGSTYWVQMGELALFLIPAAIIGLALRKPLSKFMKGYLERVEKSKIVG